MIPITNTWQPFLREQEQQPYYQELRAFLAQRYRAANVFPPMEDIFAAYQATPPEAVRVVILGQDPYHGRGQAHGLCFSVRAGVPPPPSLQNIFSEILQELGIPAPVGGCLTPWARQGVFLLNACLTVEEGRANSHAGKGWETLTDNTMAYLNALEQPIVYLLWGRYARNKKVMLTNPRQLVLEAAHPSPLSAYNGFFGCGHFQKANDYLVRNGLQPIDWSLPCD